MDQHVKLYRAFHAVEHWWSGLVGRSYVCLELDQAGYTGLSLWVAGNVDTAGDREMYEHLMKHLHAPAHGDVEYIVTAINAKGETIDVWHTVRAVSLDEVTRTIHALRDYCATHDNPAVRITVDIALPPVEVEQSDPYTVEDLAKDPLFQTAE